MLWRNCQSKFKNNGKMIFFYYIIVKCLFFTKELLNVKDGVNACFINIIVKCVF